MFANADVQNSVQPDENSPEQPVHKKKFVSLKRRPTIQQPSEGEPVAQPNADTEHLAEEISTLEQRKTELEETITRLQERESGLTQGIETLTSNQNALQTELEAMKAKLGE